MESATQLWPYLLFLPRDLEKRHIFIKSILASNLAKSVMTSFDETGKILQRDLIETLTHSNKSILAYLKALSEFGLIESGSEVYHGKRVVYHRLTKLGWSVARFFFEGLPSDIEELTKFLLEDYLSHVVSIYRNEGIPESAIFEVFSGMRTSALLSSSRDHSSPDCMVFGSSAVVTNIECPAFPPPDETSRCGSISRFPAGPTIETATTLAELGLKVSFVSSIGNDQDGRDVISSLIKSNVDVSDLFIEDGKSTNQTVIINETKTSRTMIGVDSRTALSITTPMRVPWEKLETARLVYIGEVFIEVASTIAGYARGKGIPIVYRCSIPFLEEGLDTLIPVISQVDFILLSNDAWKYLQEKVGRNPTIKLRELTDASIIARTSSNSYKVFMKNQKPLTFRSQNHHGDMTRLFSAGFIDALVHGETSERAIKRGVNNEDERRMAS